MGDMETRVAANIRRLRKKRGMTQAGLSRHLTEIGHPIPRLSLMRIENGGRRVNVDDLAALATVLATTPEHLIAEQQCASCHDTPFTGYTCNSCGVSG